MESDVNKDIIYRFYGGLQCTFDMAIKRKGDRLKAPFLLSSLHAVARYIRCKPTLTKQKLGQPLLDNTVTTTAEFALLRPSFGRTQAFYPQTAG